MRLCRVEGCFVFVQGERLRSRTMGLRSKVAMVFPRARDDGAASITGTHRAPCTRISVQEMAQHFYYTRGEWSSLH